MKKVLILIGIMVASVKLTHADNRQVDPDFIMVSTPIVVGIGYSSWSLVMGSSANAYPTTIFPGFSRTGLKIDHVDQNTQNIKIMITTADVAPASTFYGNTYLEADPPWILSFDKSRYVWAITSDLLQQLIVQELK